MVAFWSFTPWKHLWSYGLVTVHAHGDILMLFHWQPLDHIILTLSQALLTLS